MWVCLGFAGSTGWSQTTDLEFELVVHVRAGVHVESPGRTTSQHSKSGFFGDWVGIANWLGIGVMSNCSHSSRLESVGVEHVAESQGGLGDRRHKEGLPRRVFNSKGVIFAISGARIAAITSMEEFLS